MKNLKIVLALTALVLSNSANAALIERLDGMAYYDDVADLTWLSDANYAHTTGYTATLYTPANATWFNGRMYLPDALTWAAELDLGGVTGWRLPDTLDPDPSCGAGNVYCTGSEMGNLFYNVLGGEAPDHSIHGTHNSNFDLFTNIGSEYWSATEYAPNPTGSQWTFDFSYGDQWPFVNDDIQRAWAVHSGDVGAVPEPATILLFGSGLIGLMALARRKNN